MKLISLDFASETAASGSTTPSTSQRIPLAPPESPVHKQFVEAAREGHYRTRLEYLLIQGADVDAKGECDLTALHHAAFRGDHDTVKFLLNHGANVNQKHCYFGTPIFMAALRRHAEVVEALLKHNADLSVSCEYLATALHCACFGGDVTIFKSMLEDGQDIELARAQVIHLGALAFMADTNLILHQAISWWTRKPRLDPQIKCAPILLAAKCCHFDIMQLCRLKFYDTYRAPGTWETIATYTSESAGDASKESTSSAWSDLGFALPPNAVVPMNSTLLMWGAATLNLPLIDHLLEAAEQTDTQDTIGRTALHYAALTLEHATFEAVEKCFQRLSNGSPISLSIAETLLKLTVGVDHPALDPRTAYKWGLGIHSRCIASVFDCMTSAHEKQMASRQALESIVSYTMYPAESVELICNHAVILDGDDSEHSRVLECLATALHRALDTDASTEIISILLNWGADPNDCSSSRRLPLTDAALGLVERDIVQILMDNGADPDVIERMEGLEGQTPYKLAASLNRQDLIELFARANSSKPERCARRMSIRTRLRDCQTRVMSWISAEMPNV
jgi:ankyrin repeat protein